MEHRLGGLARDWQLKAFYVVLALGFFAALGTTLHHYPLFPLQLDSKEWLAAWLLTTCGDYYVLAFCLSTIIASTETRPYVALCWILAINLLGSAFFALYLLYRVTYYGTVALALKPNYAVDGTALDGNHKKKKKKKKKENTHEEYLLQRGLYGA
eukprot:g17554.t1